MTKFISGLSLFLFFSLSGCVHYNGTMLRALSDRNLEAPRITEQMCRDFKLAAKASVEGEDNAFYLLGKASQMKKLAEGLNKHGAQCDLAVQRLNKEENPLSDFNHGMILQSFRRSWGNVKLLAGE